VYPRPVTPTVLNNVRLESGKSYRNVIFAGGSSVRGVLHIDYSLRDVLIEDFVVERGPQNGITLNSCAGVVIENVAFMRGHVKSQPRMGFECTDRTTGTRVYQHVDQYSVTYDPQGNEAISYDGPGLPANCVIDGVTVAGAGTVLTEPWGAGLEINGPKAFYVDGLTIYRCRSHSLNLQGNGQPSGHVFRDIVLDARVTHQDVDMKPVAQMVWAKGINGAQFGGLIAQGGTGGELGYLDGSSNNDFSGVEWVDERRRPQVTQVNGSTGNIGLP
jgi:hypothetical protein